MGGGGGGGAVLSVLSAVSGLFHPCFTTQVRTMDDTAERIPDTIIVILCALKNFKR